MVAQINNWKLKNVADALFFIADMNNYWYNTSCYGELAEW